jgi:hypothetical protein
LFFDFLIEFKLKEFQLLSDFIDFLSLGILFLHFGDLSPRFTFLLPELLFTLGHVFSCVSYKLLLCLDGILSFGFNGFDDWGTTFFPEFIDFGAEIVNFLIFIINLLLNFFDLIGDISNSVLEHCETVFMGFGLHPHVLLDFDHQIGNDSLFLRLLVTIVVADLLDG